MLLVIKLQSKFIWREVRIIRRLEVTAIGGFLMEKYVWIGVIGTGPTTVDNFSVTDLHCIKIPSFVSLDMHDVWLVHKNDNFLV